jgi:hypothetical protein
MASHTSSQPVKPDSQAARNALHNREDFSLWAEAVRQQMLDALQKRQNRS